jgi:hypothetical protein
LTIKDIIIFFSAHNFASFLSILGRITPSAHNIQQKENGYIIQLPEPQFEGVGRAVIVPGLINEGVSGELIDLISGWNIPRRYQSWLEGEFNLDRVKIQFSH